MPVQVLDRRKTREPAADAPFLEARCRRLLTLLGLSRNSLSVALVGDGRMARLNRQYRGRSGPTNVLSFPAALPSDAPPEMRAALRADASAAAVFADLGDVLVSVDTAAREAEAQGKTLDARLTELMIHGVLHLAGYDHERSETEALVMWDKEKALFARMEAEEREIALPVPPVPAGAEPALNVRVDHVAALRRAGGGAEPDPVAAAALCETAGAQGIVARLREDRRHIQERDLRLLRQILRIPRHLEMAAARELPAFALDLRPDTVILVPELGRDMNAEGGLDAVGRKKKLAPVTAALREAGIAVALLVDADEAQIRAAAELGATRVDLRAVRYGGAADIAEQERELVNLVRATELALAQDLEVGIGGGLNYRNAAAVAAIPGVMCLSVGHAIVGRALLAGLDRAVREMRTLIRDAALFRPKTAGLYKCGAGG